MITHILKRVQVTSCVGMGMYGASRGYRAPHDDDADRIISGLVSGLMYGTPVLNIFPTILLINRVEIESRGLPKDVYKSNYNEIWGTCYDTY